MIDVVDEVLEGEPLYRAVDKDGNIVLDNIRLELITPVKTAGTPLNKVLFDSIKNSINTAKENRLVLSIDELNNNFTSHVIDLTRYTNYKKIKINLQCVYKHSKTSNGVFINGTSISYARNDGDGVNISSTNSYKIVNAVGMSFHTNVAEIEVDFVNKILKIQAKNDEEYYITFASFSELTNITLSSDEATGSGYKYNIYAKEEN